MLYVYDIILNWTDEDKVYEFYEWELNDDIEHIKKIPLFKIEKEKFDDVLNYEVKVNKEFLDKIYNLTEIYSSTNIVKIMYAAMLTDGIRAMAVEFNNEGNIIYRSNLLMDEEQEVIILSNKLVEYDLKMTIGKKRTYELFSTRLERDIKKILTIEINDSYEKGNIDKLKYLYFECFDKEQEDIDVAYRKLLDSIDKEINYKHNKLYEVVKLTYQNKN